MAQWRHSLFHLFIAHRSVFKFKVMGLAGSFGLLRAPSGSLAEGIYFGMHVPMKVIGGFAAAFVALPEVPQPMCHDFFRWF
jgi:hypothetical protein